MINLSQLHRSWRDPDPQRCPRLHIPPAPPPRRPNTASKQRWLGTRWSLSREGLAAHLLPAGVRCRCWPRRKRENRENMSFFLVFINSNGGWINWNGGFTMFFFFYPLKCWSIIHCKVLEGCAELPLQRNELCRDILILWCKNAKTQYFEI